MKPPFSFVRGRSTAAFCSSLAAARGVATVYLARDLRHDRLVALKVLRPDVGAALGRERFTREIKVAAGLQHPHIVSVHDSGATPTGQLWFTTPYVEGRRSGSSYGVGTH